MAVPETVAECDRQIEEYRKALRLVSKLGRQAVWDQIDRLLELRQFLALAADVEPREAPA